MKKTLTTIAATIALTAASMNAQADSSYDKTLMFKNETTCQILADQAVTIYNAAYEGYTLEALHRKAFYTGETKEMVTELVGKVYKMVKENPQMTGTAMKVVRLHNDLYLDCRDTLGG